jgi:hypothetical protein
MPRISWYWRVRWIICGKNDLHKNKNTQKIKKRIKKIYMIKEKRELENYNILLVQTLFSTKAE